jgi:hypothetical protein
MIEDEVTAMAVYAGAALIALAVYLRRNVRAWNRRPTVSDAPSRLTWIRHWFGQRT